MAVTSRRVARISSGLLRDKRQDVASLSVAGSALAQTPRKLKLPRRLRERLAKRAQERAEREARIENRIDRLYAAIGRARAHLRR